MKWMLLAASLVVLSGCVSNAAFDRDKAYSKCESISDKSSRDRCIAAAIQASERQRNDWAEEQARRNEEADARELDRVIAGAEQD